MIRHKLENYIHSRRATLLGVGPMSKNCVDATIEIANQYETPLMLIGSRRQIECAAMGGGYVNGWSTETFADYVIKNDKKGKVILARDHGGPWQNPLEVKGDFSLRQAMDSAKKSYEVDIISGFQVIHIDPSIDIHGTPDVDEVLDRVYELYSFCSETAKKHNKEIIFEIGTEEQSGYSNTLSELDYVLTSMTKFCRKNGYVLPTFVVVQTGTRVMETRNVGTFDSPFRIVGEVPAELQIPRMLELCDSHNILMKEHNTDYLSSDSLSWHPKLGIHAANVAPEFGVTETRAFLALLKEHQLEELRQEFLELSYNSKKWEKWMVKDTQADNHDRSIISGHYVFSTPEFKSIKERAQNELSIKNIDIEDHLKTKVKDSILRYVFNFNLAVQA